MGKHMPLPLRFNTYSTGTRILYTGMRNENNAKTGLSSERGGGQPYPAQKLL